MSILKSKLKGFTLLELLIVIGILAILATAVLMVINPVHLLQETRDSRRVTELGETNEALILYQTEGDSNNMGDSNVVYTSLPDSSSDCSSYSLPSLPSGWSYHCVSQDNLRKVDGTGWIPVNFASISVGTPLTALPVDPVNTNTGGLYYTYVHGSWELTTALESTKYQTQYASKDGGENDTVYEVASEHAVTPVAVLDRHTAATTTTTTAPPQSGSEILQPDGPGSETNIPTASGCTNHWECVDDVTADDDSTYVESDTDITRDLYSIQNHSTGTGTINKVIVYARVENAAACSAFCDVHATTSIATYGTVYNGSGITLSASNAGTWTTFSSEWDTNPYTGNPWTWDEIDNLEAGAQLSGCDGDNTSCPSMSLIPNTPVLMADLTLKKIEDIKVGDYVVSYDFSTKKLVKDKVIRTIHHQNSYGGYYLFNYSLGASATHRIYVEGKGYIPASSIKIGDYLINEKGEEYPVFYIQYINVPLDLYDLVLESPPHNFFANGYLVHNWTNLARLTQVYVEVDYTY